jgi:hypothetical protein
MILRQSAPRSNGRWKRVIPVRSEPEVFLAGLAATHDLQRLAATMK